MSRILAIDYGKKRTGIAVSDMMKIIAQGLTTVETSKLMTFLKDYFMKESVEKVIIGLPRQTTGELSENAARVQVFCNRFRKEYPTMPLETCDERFTSVMAHQIMLDGGLKKKARRNKALVDEISATLILEEYLESQRV